MSLLFRYLTKNNAMILLPTLAVGIGLYVLTDLFERLDNFIEAGLSVGMVLTYFVEDAAVISQILPVIFRCPRSSNCASWLAARAAALQAGASPRRGGKLHDPLRHFLGRRPAWFLEYLGVAGNASPPASGRKRSARRTSRQRC
ncbi:MAG: hypothetical protein ACLSHC_01870 [Bilophila wadsworthia]